MCIFLLYIQGKKAPWTHLRTSRTYLLEHERYLPSPIRMIETEASTLREAWDTLESYAIPTISLDQKSKLTYHQNAPTVRVQLSCKDWRKDDDILHVRIPNLGDLLLDVEVELGPSDTVHTLKWIDHGTGGDVLAECTTPQCILNPFPESGYPLMLLNGAPCPFSIVVRSDSQQQPSHVIRVHARYAYLDDLNRGHLMAAVRSAFEAIGSASIYLPRTDGSLYALRLPSSVGRYSTSYQP